MTDQTKPDPKKMATLTTTLKDLSDKAANLMKLTKAQEDFGNRKQDCFLEMLKVIEQLATAFESNEKLLVVKLSDRAKEILTKYQDDLGKEEKES